MSGDRTPPDAFIQGIAQSASAIFDERKRLNDAFAALQAAVAAIRPGAVLQDDGTLHYLGDFIPSAAELPPEPEPTPTPEPTPEPGTMRERILALLEPGVRKSAPRIATELAANPNSISATLSKMRTAGEVVRIEPSASGHSVAVFMRASGVTTRPTTDGSQTNSGSESLRPSDSNADDRTPPASDKDQEEGSTSGGTAGPSTGQRQGSPGSSPEDPTTPPSGSGATRPAASSASNLARSPIPRDEMRGPQRAAENRLDDIVLWLADQPDHKGNPKDAEEDLHLPDHILVKAFRDLADRGVFVKVGPVWSKRQQEVRASGGKTPGRQTIEYKVSSEVLKQIPKGDVAEEPPHVGADPGIEVGGTENLTPSDAAVRDALINFEGTIEELAVKMGIEPEERNIEDLRTLVSKWILKGAVEIRGSVLHYVPPTDPGSAARADMARTPQERTAEANGPVAGTGRGFRAANKDVQALIDAARKAGASKIEPSGGHIRITAPDGTSVNISSTPGNPRTLLNDRTRLRRLFPSIARG